MPMPQSLPQYLKEIQDYLNLQKTNLKNEWKIAGGSLEEDPFPELTQAIACVEDLKSIQAYILHYYEQLNN